MPQSPLITIGWALLAKLTKKISVFIKGINATRPEISNENHIYILTLFASSLIPSLLYTFILAWAKIATYRKFLPGLFAHAIQALGATQATNHFTAGAPLAGMFPEDQIIVNLTKGVNQVSKRSERKLQSLSN